MDIVFRIVGFDSYAEFIEYIFIQADLIDFIADTDLNCTKYYLLLTPEPEQNWLPEELIDKYEILRDTKAEYLKKKKRA